MRLKATTIGFLLVATGLSSFALTFGRVQGAAWIGQPLNLVVPVQVETGQTAASLCAQADVFHADSKQDSNRVQVSVDPSAQPDTFLVRISSSTLVDEPVVTVYLRTGCEQKNTRRFVLLADFPTEGAPVAPRLAAEALAQVPTITPVESAAPAKASTAAATSTALGTKAVDPSAATPASKAEPKPELKPEPKLEAKAAAKPAPEAVAKKPVAKPAAKPAVKAETPPKPVAAPAAAASPAQKGPRLKLDPLEVLAERVQSLESTSTAQPPQDPGQDAQRMQQLQNDVKALLEQASKNEASLLLMRQRLEKAESEQVPMGLVYGLVALLALALAGLAAMWSQRKKSAPWQDGVADASGPVTVAPLVHEDAWHSQPVTVSPTTATTAAAKDEQVDVDMIEMDEDLFKAPANATAAPQASSPALSEPRSGHPEFSSDSVLDAIQGAEFFTKLGKTDEAIQTLENTIRTDGTGSALLYLELMRIAQDKSLKTDFRQFRDEFQGKFNATVPEFALFRDEGKGLEGRPELLEHICRSWSSPNVLEMLESCILREPFDKSPKPFDLAAFRELVLLHGIALHHATQAKATPTKEEEHVIDFEL